MTLIFFYACQTSEKCCVQQVVIFVELRNLSPMTLIGFGLERHARSQYLKFLWVLFVSLAAMAASERWEHKSVGII